MRVATVLYEDKMQPGTGGAFPPHDFLLAMVGDLIGKRVWDLREPIEGKPRKGIGNLIKDLEHTSQIAGAGKLCVVVDRDRVAEHLGLNRIAPEAEVTAKLRERSDAPEKLSVHYLDPNMEGLMRSIQVCAPGEPAPRGKGHNSRDIYLNRAACALTAAVRDCVKGKQPSRGTLAEMLAGLCSGAEA